MTAPVLRTSLTSSGVLINPAAITGCCDGYDHHGRSSYKVKVAFVSGSTELINADLCGGKTASNGGFLGFLKETLAKIDPRKTVIEGIRIDHGFFDEANFIYLEDQDPRYVCKGKMTGGMKKVLNYLNEQDAR